jgi:subtilisin family serine protease
MSYQLEPDQERPLALTEVADAPSDLDPHLVHLLDQETQALVGAASLAEDETGVTVVEVIAKLSDPAIAVPGLNVTQAMGQIVTGTVALADIQQVRNDPNVVSLKRAIEVRADLEVSVPEIEADAATLNCQPRAQRNGVLNGQGIVVGIVDFGCDFLHANFRNRDGSTRILYLWDQSGSLTASSPAPYRYGREYTAADINRALAQATPPAPGSLYGEDARNRAYLALGYTLPRSASPAARGQHGTHVMDIAAGNGRGSGMPGVAPAADLIFVHLAAGDVGGEESFGNSKRLLDAVRYIFDKAGELGKPCVVNLSLGTHGGPHDGSTLVEQGLDSLLEQSGRAIVVSAGNSYAKGIHARGEVMPGVPYILSWRIVEPRPGEFPLGAPPSELEIWYPGGEELAVTLVSPTGQMLGPTALGKTYKLGAGAGGGSMIVHRRGDPNNGDNHVDILLGSDMPAGIWQVQLSAMLARPTSFHAWIERADGAQSTFAANADPAYTLGSISCGRKTLTVGSYDARHGSRGISNFSSAGPTRDGRDKPDGSAPGQNVVAAWSLTHTRTVQKSGTSMAAPHVTGAVALIMQSAGRMLTTEELRTTVLSSARRQPPEGTGWSDRYGFGRVHAAGMIRALAAVGQRQPLVASLPVR